MQVIHNKAVITYDKSSIKVDMRDSSGLVRACPHMWARSGVQIIFSLQIKIKNNGKI